MYRPTWHVRVTATPDKQNGQPALDREPTNEEIERAIEAAITDALEKRMFGPAIVRADADKDRPVKLLWKQTRPGGTVHPLALPGDVGYDLEAVESVVLMPGEVRDIPLGVAVELPLGRWGELTHRSSAPRKLGIQVMQGTIDNGYRGELFALAQNITGRTVFIDAGMRIAQLIVHHVNDPVLEQVTELSESVQGLQGFGSTGTNGDRTKITAEPIVAGYVNPLSNFGDDENDRMPWQQD